MEILINQQFDFDIYKKIDISAKLKNVYKIEIMTLKQVLQILVRLAIADPFFIPMKNHILIYMENKYISTWIVTENLWGNFNWIESIYTTKDIYSYKVSLSDLKILYYDIISKRNGKEKYTKIAFTDKGLVYKHEKINILLKTELNIEYNYAIPFNFNMNKVNYIDKTISERRKIINLYYPELLDILTYFPVTYSEFGIKYTTDRSTILGKLKSKLSGLELENSFFNNSIINSKYDDLIF